MGQQYIPTYIIAITTGVIIAMIILFIAWRKGSLNKRIIGKIMNYYAEYIMLFFAFLIPTAGLLIGNMYLSRLANNPVNPIAVFLSAPLASGFIFAVFSILAGFAADIIYKGLIKVLKKHVDNKDYKGKYLQFESITSKITALSNLLIIGSLCASAKQVTQALVCAVLAINIFASYPSGLTETKTRLGEDWKKLKKLKCQEVIVPIVTLTMVIIFLSCNNAHSCPFT